MTENEKNLTAYVLSPQGEKPTQLTEEDVWGKWDKGERVSTGMIVARYGETCPHFQDIVPYKSITVVCKVSQIEEVEYWLEYCHGAGCVVDAMTIGDDLLAVRSTYMAD